MGTVRVWKISKYVKEGKSMWVWECVSEWEGGENAKVLNCTGK